MQTSVGLTSLKDKPGNTVFDLANLAREGSFFAFFGPCGAIGQWVAIHHVACGMREYLVLLSPTLVDSLLLAFFNCNEAKSLTFTTLKSYPQKKPPSHQFKSQPPTQHTST